MPALQFICPRKKLHEWGYPFYRQLNVLKKQSYGLLCFYANSKAPNLQTNDFIMSIQYRTYLEFTDFDGHKKQYLPRFDPLDNYCPSTTKHYRKEWWPHTCWQEPRLSGEPRCTPSQGWNQVPRHPHPGDVRDTQQGAGLSSRKANPESAPGEAGLALPSAVTAAPPPPRDGVRGGTSSGGLEVMRPTRCGDNEDHVVSQNSYPCPSIINK